MIDEDRWRKKNIVGLKDRKGIYDLWACSVCGTEYRRYTLAWNPPKCKCEEGEGDGRVNV